MENEFCIFTHLPTFYSRRSFFLSYKVQYRKLDWPNRLRVLFACICHFHMMFKCVVLVAIFCLQLSISDGKVDGSADKKSDPFLGLKWLAGHWKGNNEGKVFWPTIPKMTYTEELIIRPAPMAKNVNIRFLSFEAKAWSPSEFDHMHNELGYMTIDSNGNVTLMTTSDNGFSTLEEGWVEPKRVVLRLKKIGRISFNRDLPVEDLERKFIFLDDNHLEQTLAMRTALHPRIGLLDHSYILYEKSKDK